MRDRLSSRSPLRLGRETPKNNKIKRAWKCVKSTAHSNPEQHLLPCLHALKRNDHLLPISPLAWRANSLSSTTIGTNIGRRDEVRRVQTLTTAAQTKKNTQTIAMSTDAAADAAPKSEQEILSTYRRMQSEMQGLVQNLTKIEMERNEHRYVVWGCFVLYF